VTVRSKVMTQIKRDTPAIQVGGLGRGSGSLTPYKSIVSQTHDTPRIKERKYNTATATEKTNGT
jgi:hypothetical protein